MPRTRLLLVLPLLLHTVACIGGRSNPVAPDHSASAAELPASHGREPLSWSAIMGVRLRSVQLHGGGLGPDGPVLQHQFLTLGASGTFELLHADIVEQGTYRLDGLHLVGHTRGMDLSGELDPERGVLRLNGIEFELPQVESRAPTSGS